jgi:catechol 2,3 dioxygenase
MTPELAKLGHIALRTPDLARSLAFFTDVIGLDEVARAEGVVHLRAWGEREHHSLSLREGPTGVDHIAFRTRRPEHVAAFAQSLAAAGIEVAHVEAGAETGQGEAIRFVTPNGHPFELYYAMETPDAPAELRSRLRSNVARPFRRGASPRRIDHVNLADTEVEPGLDWLAAQLGFRLRECVRSERHGIVAGWTSVTSQVHDIALGRDLGGRRGTLHHLAYWLDTREEVMRAADLVLEAGIPIDHGPGMHGIARSFFCYVRDPGSGHRVELYSGSYQIFDPDWAPVEWDASEIRAALSWWGPEYLPGRGHRFDETTPCIEGYAQ